MSSDSDTLPDPNPAAQGVESPAAPAGQAPPDYKAELVKELMADPADVPAPPTPEPKVEDKKEEAAEPPKPTEPEKAETPEPKKDEPSETPAEDTDPELVEPGENATKGEKIAWGKLKAELKRAKEDAQFGNIVAKVGASAGITPDEMAGWVGIRARLKSGDPQALADLKQMVGIRDPEPPKPAMSEVADKVYKDLFADAVESSDMTEEAARKKSTLIAERMIAQQAPPPERREQVQPKQTVDPVHDAASAELDRLDAEMASKVPKWAELRKEVFEVIATKHAGAPPIRWVPIFNEVAREIQVKYAKPAAPPKVKPTESLKPSVSASSANATPNYKADLIRDLMAGKV